MRGTFSVNGRGRGFGPVKMLTCKGKDDNSKSACCRHQTKEEKYFPLESPKLTNVSEHLIIWTL